MAELLLFNRSDLWYNDSAKYTAENLRLEADPTLDAAATIAAKEVLSDMKTGGDKVGDITEVQEDGFYSVEHGWNRNAFILLMIPGVPKKDVEYLDTPVRDGERCIHKHEYQVDVGSLRVDTKQVTIGKKTFTERTITVPSLAAATVTDKVTDQVIVAAK